MIMRNYHAVPVEDDVERTMREEGWSRMDELLAEDYPPLVKAFKLLDESAWEEFVDQVSVDPDIGIQFFNSESGEMYLAVEWEDLSWHSGVLPYPAAWALPARVSPAALEFCREFRAAVRGAGEDMASYSREVFLGGHIIDHSRFAGGSRPEVIIRTDGEFLGEVFNPELAGGAVSKALLRAVHQSLRDRGLALMTCLPGFVPVGKEPAVWRSRETVRAMDGPLIIDI